MSVRAVRDHTTAVCNPYLSCKYCSDIIAKARYNILSVKQIFFREGLCLALRAVYMNDAPSGI
jgi:hypothetical protein